MASHSHPSSTANIVGAHYRVGKKIGEGSFGVIFEGELSLPFALCSQLTAQIFIGTNLLNSQTVAIKFVRYLSNSPNHSLMLCCNRNRGRLKLLNFVTNVVLTVFSLGVVSPHSTTSPPPTLKVPPFSWDTANLSLWAGGVAQYFGHRPSWTESRRSF